MLDGLCCGAESLRGLFLSQAMEKVHDRWIFRWFRGVAKQLTTHNLRSEVGELDAKREEKFHASAS